MDLGGQQRLAGVAQHNKSSACNLIVAKQLKLQR